MDGAGHRILAQCKNDPELWDAMQVAAWTRMIRPTLDDRLYFFNRGGFTGTVQADIELVDGAAISVWLEARPEYFRRLRLL